jgi:6-phosphogluconolactonase
MAAEHDVVTLPDPVALAKRAAEFVAERARQAVEAHGVFNFAVSGGKTPWAMFAELAHEDVAWGSVVLFQCDERVAPDGDPDRNLTNLYKALGDAKSEAKVVAMPVNDADLDAAASTYASLLPERFDLVHLGIGPDGHTASLVPGDAVLEITDRLVGVTGDYQQHRRMTLTYPALARADEIVWLISGADKREAVGKLLAGDTSVPAGRVSAKHQTVICDAPAVEG